MQAGGDRRAFRTLTKKVGMSDIHVSWAEHPLSKGWGVKTWGPSAVGRQMTVRP